MDSRLRVSRPRPRPKLKGSRPRKKISCFKTETIEDHDLTNNAEFKQALAKEKQAYINMCIILNLLILFAVYLLHFLIINDNAG